MIFSYSLLLNKFSFTKYDCSSIPDGSNKPFMSDDLWGHLWKNWNFPFSKMKKNLKKLSDRICQVQLLYRHCIIWRAQMLVLVQICWTIQSPTYRKDWARKGHWGQGHSSVPRFACISRLHLFKKKKKISCEAFRNTHKPFQSFFYFWYFETRIIYFMVLGMWRFLYHHCWYHPEV